MTDDCTSRQDRLVQRDPDPPAGDGQDGVDGSPGGRVGSHSALPHHAADCDGLLEVSLNQPAAYYQAAFHC